MKCPYCQAEMEQISHTPSSMNSVEITVWECNVHAPVIYRACTTNPHYTHDYGSLIVPIKERWYCVNLNPEKGQYTLEELEHQKTNPRNFSLKTKVTSVPDSLHITADNAVDKLKTILVFM